MGGDAEIRYSCGMSALPQPQQRRGVELLLAHFAALDPVRVPARERLQHEVGEELADRLVRSLSGGPRPKQPPAPQPTQPSEYAA